MKTIILLSAVLLTAPVFALDTKDNPDRFPSLGFDISKGKLPGVLTSNQPGAPATDGGFVKGAFDFQLPVTNALTVRTFGSTTGVNNSLQFSEGNELGVGLRVYIR